MTIPVCTINLTLGRLPLHSGAVSRVDQLRIVVVVITALSEAARFPGTAKTSANVLIVDDIVQVGVACHGEGTVWDLDASVKHGNLK